SVVGNRFLDEHMLSLGKESPGNVVVSIGRRCHRSCVNRCDELIEGFGTCRAEFARNGAALERLYVVYRGELSGRNFPVEPCMITPDMPNTNNANAKLFHRSLMQSTPKAFTGQRSKLFGNDLLSARLARNQSEAWAMPSRNGIVGFQPSSRILVTSKSFRGVPSGFVLSQASSPRKPTTSQINSASSRMVTSSPQPM